MSRQIAIIGNGISGVTAARFIRKRCDDPITIISGESDHFYSRTALMYIYMGHLTLDDTKPYEDWFWAKNRIELLRETVSEVDTAGKHLTLSDGARLNYDVLIVATGSVSNKFGWPGQDLPGVQGLYGLQDLEQMEASTRGISRAVVVGGGLIGIEVAEMLHARHVPVTFLVREAGYMDYLLPPDESEMVNREIRDHHIDLRLGTELDAVLPDVNGRAGAVRTKAGDVIDCGFVALAVGVSPNIGFLAGSGIETGKGVLVNEFFETGATDVYAVGDCVQFRDPEIGHRSIEQLWYTGRRHGKTVARTICGERTPYDRGVFFNSAKFFTIEYQTYGDVAPSLPEEQETKIWQDRVGKRLVRVNYERASRRVTGFNLMGVRFRHETCERWLRSGATVDEVLPSLGDASFDPEFSRAGDLNYLSLA